MSFKDTQSYKELQSDWRWIHSMDPEAAAAADQWVKEHPEEWKELEHMLYYSEANFHKRVAPDTLEDVDIKQPRSYNPEAFLPEEVRNAIYDDMRWFDRAKYLPEGSDEDPLISKSCCLPLGSISVRSFSDTEKTPATVSFTSFDLCSWPSAKQSRKARYISSYLGIGI